MVVFNHVLSVLLSAFFNPFKLQRKPNICILSVISSDLSEVNSYRLSSSSLRHWILHSLWRRRPPRRQKKVRLQLLWKRFLHIFWKHHKTDHHACSLSWKNLTKIWTFLLPGIVEGKKKDTKFLNKYPSVLYCVNVTLNRLSFLQDKT